MKSKETLGLRLFYAYKFITKDKSKGGVGTKCSVCDSFKVELVSGSDEKIPIGVAHRSVLKCLDCGSIATVSELWSIPSSKEDVGINYEDS